MPTRANVIDMSDLSVERLVARSPEQPYGVQVDCNLGNYDDVDGHEYTYDGLDRIEPGEPNTGDRNVQILMYRVVSSTVKPFLMFCLYRDDNSLGFANLLGEKATTGRVAEEKMRSVLQGWRGTVKYQGFMLEDGIVTLCLEYTDGDMLVDNAKIDNRWWWVLATEIVNEKRMLTFDVKREVVGFFERNPSMLFLKDELGRLYETPAVGYYGSYANRIAVTSVLGKQKAAPTDVYGPYYYFGNYEAAMRFAIWSETFTPLEVEGEIVTNDRRGRYLRGGLVRFALFLGKTTVMMDRQSDSIDRSETTKELARLDPLVAMTRKLRDVDANWILEYNSVQTGEVTQVPFDMLDTDNKGEISVEDWKKRFGVETGFSVYNEAGDGKITEEEWTNGIRYVGAGNRTVVKEYNQQVPLAYYYVNTDQDTSDLREVRVE